ncbi:MAG: nuclear transport factor 2 family protein [Saprospiraceae bacterium]|nr:nuclear transport factor 2 family protein [Saprospiraceae bacterium]
MAHFNVFQLKSNALRTFLTIVATVLVFVIFTSQALPGDRENQDKAIDAWHNAAAAGDSATFFGLMTEDAIYLGTDLSERWDRASMARDLGKYFRGRKAWHFVPYNRHYLELKDNNKILFDESLKTWMGPCKATGMLTKTRGSWKISYYNLSVAVPNQYVKQYTKLLPPNEILSN